MKGQTSKCLQSLSPFCITSPQEMISAVSWKRPKVGAAITDQTNVTDNFMNYFATIAKGIYDMDLLEAIYKQSSKRSGTVIDTCL